MGMSVNEAFGYLEATLRRIEELATDTPTWGDQERALDAIKGECQEALSAVFPHTP